MAARRRVLIVLPREVHLMDVAGPAQVFTSAADAGAGYTVEHVADEPLVASHQGVQLAAGTGWPDLAPDDVVLVPGWKTQRCEHPVSDELLDRVRGHWERGGQVASVCAGSLLLAGLGVLAGQPATTHHDLVAVLHRFPGVQVQRDVLYTCAPRLHTSAGIASGIDLALHLVAHDHGPAFAARIARTMVVPAWRPGGAPQASVLLRHRNHMDDLAHRAQDLLDDPANATLPLSALAARLGVSDRTLARHVRVATGLTPHQYQTAVRRERAEQLVAQGWSREAAARQVGWADARSLRRR